MWRRQSVFTRTKNMFIKMNMYTDNINEATIALFNSHHHLNFIHQLKTNNPNIKIFHRIDGLHQLWRANGKQTDDIVNYFANNFADGVIFQSEWSKMIFQKHGIYINKKPK